MGVVARCRTSALSRGEKAGFCSRAAVIIGDLHCLGFRHDAAVEAAGASHHCASGRLVLGPPSGVRFVPGDAVHDGRMFHHVPMLAAGARPANATPAERG
ncbi:hypothetical protein ACFXGR_55830 [Streptomyces mirabilis]|uniref:hypothetical protein n=1 Tax=Streptomyces mirabilis TaxID=68239 RepID=UPI0036C8BAA6